MHATQASQAKEWQLRNLEEASKNTRGIFYLYLGAVAYCFLTVVGTSDRRMALGEKVVLPIVDVEVSLYGFFLIAPVLLLTVFSYFQLYLQRMQGLKRQLRSHGEIEYRREYPWMINIADSPEAGAIGLLQKIVVLGALWWPLPLVLNVFYLWTIKLQDPVLSGILRAEAAVGTIAVFFFWRAYRPEKRIWKIHFMFMLAAMFSLPQLAMDRYWPAVWSVLSSEPFDEAASFDPRYLNLNYQNLINESNAEYPGLPLANFNGMVFRRAKLVSAVFMRADLRHAEMQDAVMRNANLKRAWLDSTYLDSANLSQAVLDSASMIGAFVRDAESGGASLKHANMTGASLQSAEFYDARLDSANMADSRLEGANFFSASLKGANLRNAILDSAVLSFASLHGADLNGASLVGADFTGANLSGCDLRYAKVSARQLLHAYTLFGAKVNPDIENLALEGTALWSSLHEARPPADLR